MNTYPILIHSRKYKEKPSLDGLSMSKLYAGLKEQQLTLEEIAYIVGENGQTTMNSICSDPNDADTFEKAQVMFLDFDNDLGDEYYITAEEALMMAFMDGLEPFVMYKTFSHTPQHERFRMGFAFDEVIETEERRLQVLGALVNVFRSNDKYLVDYKICKNANRFIFGGKGITHLNPQAITPVADLDLQPLPNVKKDYQPSIADNSNTSAVVKKSISLMIEAIRMKDVKAVQQLVMQHDVRPYGLNFDLPYKTTITIDEVKRIPLNILLGLPLDTPISCIIDGHEDKNPSAYVAYNKLTCEYHYRCAKCGGFDVFDIIEKTNGMKFKESKMFLEEVLNITIITRYKDAQRRRVLDSMNYFSSDQFAVDYPVLAKSLRRYNDWAHLKFYMTEALNFIGDAPLLHRGQLAFFQSSRYSAKRMAMENIRGNIYKIAIHLRELGLLQFLGLDELTPYQQKQVKLHMEILKEKEKKKGKNADNYKYFTSHYEIPVYNRELLENAQQVLITRKEKGATKRGTSKVQLMNTHGIEKANEIYAQSKKEFVMTKEEEAFFKKYVKVVDELVSTQGYVHETEIINKIRTKGMKREQKKTLTQKFRTWSTDNGYKLVTCTKVNKATYNIPASFAPNAKVLVKA